MMDYKDSQFRKVVEVIEHRRQIIAIIYELDDEESNSEFLNDFRKAALMGIWKCAMYWSIYYIYHDLNWNF